MYEEFAQVNPEASNVGVIVTSGETRHMLGEVLIRRSNFLAQEI